MEKNANKTKVASAKTIGMISTILVSVISILLFGSLFLLSTRFNNVQSSTNNYMSWKQTVLDVKDASDYLTDQVRYYVYNHKKVYMDNYFEEANVRQRRDKAIAIIEEHLPDSEVYRGIEAAVNKSKELMNDEFYAMRLVVESLHITMDDTYPNEVKSVVLSDEDIALSDKDKETVALEYVIGEKYLSDKYYIVHKINDAVSEIDTMMEKDVISSTAELKNILIMQQILIGLNILISAIALFLIYSFMIRPLNYAIESLKNNEDMEFIGAREFRYMATVYNDARKQSNSIKEKLIYEAEHDQLTGLYNRSGYDAIYRRAKLASCYYILIDIDFFKSVNDKYGHEVGDKVLVKVATTINEFFDKENEFAFRLGGDEFAVLIEHNENIPVEDVTAKCQMMSERINKEGTKTTHITLSIGIAKGDKNDTTDSLFRKADKALYDVKNNGRHNISVYKE